MEDASGRAHGALSSLGKNGLAWERRPSSDFFQKTYPKNMKVR